MAIDLTSAWRKQQRGYRHYQSLVAQITRWNATHVNPEALRVHFRYDHIRKGLLIRPVWELDVPVEWALVFGDAIAAYRNALDHLAWAAVLAGHSPQAVDQPDKARDIAFPVIGRFDPKGKRTFEMRWAGASKRRLPGVDVRVENLIRDAQPDDSDRQPLLWLHHLSNEDKHRQIALVHAVATGLEMDYSIRGFIQQGPQSSSRVMNDRGALVHEIFVPGEPYPGRTPDIRPEKPQLAEIGHIVAGLGVEAEQVLRDVNALVTQLLKAAEDALSPTTDGA